MGNYQDRFMGLVLQLKAALPLWDLNLSRYPYTDIYFTVLNIDFLRKYSFYEGFKSNYIPLGGDG